MTKARPFCGAGFCSVDATRSVETGVAAPAHKEKPRWAFFGRRGFLNELNALPFERRGQ